MMRLLSDVSEVSEPVEPGKANPTINALEVIANDLGLTKHCANDGLRYER